MYETKRRRGRASVATLMVLVGSCASPAPPPTEPPIELPAEPLTVFEGTRVVFGAQDTPVRYDVRGAGTPTLVFVHGWCGNRAYWREQVEAFSERYRVVAIDLGGHGESGKNRSEWTTPTFVEDVEAVCADLDLRDVIFVAHSTGASVALEVALALRWRTIGVIGVDALHDVTRPTDEDALQESIRSMRADFPAFVESFVRNQSAPDTDPELVARITREMGATDPHIALRVLSGFARTDDKAALQRCPVPVLCINAEGLRATRVDHNQEYSAAFSAVVLRGAGHFLMLERPEEFNRELERAIETLLNLRDRR